MTQERKDELYDEMIAWITEHIQDDDKLFHVLTEELGMTQEELHDHCIESLDEYFPPLDPETRLKQKVEKCYEDYKAKWLRLSPAELISRAEEIAAVTKMAEFLPDTLSYSDMEFLLRFKNPLEVASEAWTGYDFITDDELSHVLWRYQQDESIFEAFEMEPAYVKEMLEKQTGITVKEFMEAHPDAGLDMMTPSGYVHISPGQYSEVIKSGKIPAHLGVSGTDFYLDADDILSQEIRSINQSPDDPTLFYVLSGEPEFGEETETQDFDMTM